MMKKLLLSTLAVVTALGPISAAPAWAGNGAAVIGMQNDGDNRGGREGRNWRSDRGRDDRGGDRNWNRGGDDNRNWKRDGDRHGNWNRDGGRHWADNRWDRRDDRWDRRDDRWDRRDDRWDRRRHWDRGHDYSDNRGWRRGHHNGYYYRNSWYFGPPPVSYYGDRYYRPGYRHWARGYRCPDYYRDDVVYDYYSYGLRRPPRGYRWVRADDDFLMIAAATGIIAAVILNDY